MFRSFLSLVTHSLANFDALIQKGFWVIQKKYKLIIHACHSILIISLKSPNGGQERRKLQKFESLYKEKSILARSGQIKAFSKIFNVKAFGEI